MIQLRVDDPSFESARADEIAALSGRFAVPRDVGWTEWRNSIVAVVMSRGRSYVLEDVAARAWASLTSGRSIGECARAVTARYDVEWERAALDLAALASDLVAEGLLVQLLPETAA